MSPSGARTSEHLSSLELDLLEAGALDAARAKGASEHLEVCAECREQRASLHALHREFEQDVFPRTAPRFRGQRENTVPFYRRAVVWVPALASAAAVVLALRANVSEGPTAPETPQIQVKGGSGLSLLVRRNGADVPFTSSKAELRAGDELRFVLVSTEQRAKQVLIVSVDGAGTASVYFPFEGRESLAIPQRGRWEVPGSVILDETRGPERIFALLSPDPLDARPVLAELERLGKRGWEAIRGTPRLDLAGVEQHSLLVEKVVTPKP